MCPFGEQKNHFRRSITKKKMQQQKIFFQRDSEREKENVIYKYETTENPYGFFFSIFVSISRVKFKIKK